MIVMQTAGGEVHMRDRSRVDLVGIEHRLEVRNEKLDPVTLIRSEGHKGNLTDASTPPYFLAVSS